MDFTGVTRPLNVFVRYRVFGDTQNSERKHSLSNTSFEMCKDCFGKPWLFQSKAVRYTSNSETSAQGGRRWNHRSCRSLVYSGGFSCQGSIVPVIGETPITVWLPVKWRCLGQCKGKKFWWGNSVKYNNLSNSDRYGPDVEQHVLSLVQKSP